MEFNKMNIRTWSMLGPSGAFGLAACELAKNDKDFAVLTADLCNFSGLDRFAKNYPQQFYNIGIAEQNMIGVAAGMTKEGMNTFVTTYASFISTRVMDQVKVNLGYMGLPVKLVGLTSGFSAGILGATHMALEDIAIIRAIPNIVILSPADAAETMKSVLAAAQLNVPVYIRMSGASRSPVLHNGDFDFEIGKAIRLKDGKDIAIFATGTMVSEAMTVADRFSDIGISCEVTDIHTIKPIDYEAIGKACSKKLIVTVEEHSRIGGLGSTVAEVLAPISCVPPQLLIGTDDTYLHAASYSTLMERSGLTAEQIYNQIFKFYKENI